VERQWTIGEFEGHEVEKMRNKRVEQEQRLEMVVAEREVDIGCRVGHRMVHGGW